MIGIESLETRRFLHADLSVAVNFQPSTGLRAPGMVIDYGSTFDFRRGGNQYGWTTDLSANVVRRNVSPIIRNDTFITVPAGAKWEFAVDPGVYRVYVVAGDPAQVNERTGILVEGQVAASGITRRARPYIEGSVTVNVTDGRLTIEGAPWTSENKLAYLAIQSTHEESAKSVSITATRPQASEQGPVAGEMTITRTGDLTDELTVPLTVSGSATNITDYGRIGPRVTFAAGVESIRLKVAPVVDGINEGDETVTVSLNPVGGYQLGQTSATVTISDTPAVQGTLAWQTRASLPVGKAEAFGGQIGGKLYVFGGYVDNSFRPIDTAHVYDPATNAWSSIANLPERLSHAATAFDGNFMYFAGGYPATATAQTFATAKVYRYDATTNTYTSLPDLPQARGAAAGAIVNGVYYVMGGANASRQDRTEVWALDLNNLAGGWVQKASLPEARNHPAAVSMGGFVYFLGGQTGQDEASVYKNTVWRYNPSSNTWQTLASMSSARSHITNSTMVFNNTIITMGGEGVAQAKLRNVDQYNPITNTWTALTSLPSARFSGIADLINGQIYFTAGYNSTFEKTTWRGTFA